MKTITLSHKHNSGALLEATFLPEMGMNLASFKKGEIELIDPSTKAQFEERFAGLGALIGPHFHRKRAQSVPPVPNEELFPHIARVKAKGIADPFSHGISRYAPWNAAATTSSVNAILSGKDTWHDVKLSVLEGQDFTYTFSAELNDEGMRLKLAIVSATDSLVGIHYYYRLPDGKGKITSRVQDFVLENGHKVALPKEWKGEDSPEISVDLTESFDTTFYPFDQRSGGYIKLETSEYTLTTKYSAPSEENSWQLYHPKGASFVCIEPLSAQDPHHPNLTVSSLIIDLFLD